MDYAPDTYRFCSVLVKVCCSRSLLAVFHRFVFWLL